ncbi:hypothetical protein GW17_00046073 [Ensete ventricosum]|nr:hypothetical protein GW17_00046073 [Ensete ventricosum]
MVVICQEAFRSPFPRTPLSHFLKMLAAQFSSSCACAGLRGPLLPPPRRRGRRSRCSAAPGGDSYLDMWKKAMERERRAQQSRGTRDSGEGGKSPSLEAKTERFNQLLQVPTEERDRVQRLQVIDRAAAAFAAARAILDESPVARSTPDRSERPEVSRAKQGVGPCCPFCFYIDCSAGKMGSWHQVILS